MRAKEIEGAAAAAHPPPPPAAVGWGKENAGDTRGPAGTAPGDRGPDRAPFLTPPGRLLPADLTLERVDQAD